MLVLDPVTVLGACLWALLLDLVLGDPPALWRRVPHPVVWVGRAIAHIEARFDPTRHTPAENLRAGALATAALVILAALTGLLAHRLIGEGPLAALLLGTLAWPLFAWRSLDEHATVVVQARPSHRWRPR